MPLYEYECRTCGEVTERECKASERPVRVKCSSCTSMRTFQIISSNSFQLKGSGWYVTDYKGKGRK